MINTDELKLITPIEYQWLEKPTDNGVEAKLAVQQAGETQWAKGEEPSAHVLLSDTTLTVSEVRAVGKPACTAILHLTSMWARSHGTKLVRFNDLSTSLEQTACEAFEPNIIVNL